jgi:hypothetical protein
MGFPVIQRRHDGSLFDKSFFFALIIAMTFCLPGVPADAALLCHYKFDGNLLDSSVNNHPAGDGTLQGNAHYVTGKFGQALDFDGAGDFIRIMVAAGSNGGWSPRVKVSNAISVTMWIKMDAYPTADVDLLASRGWSPGDNNFEFHQGGFGYQTPFFVVQQGTFLTEYPHKRITSDKLGKWIHLAMTYDAIGGQSCMYVNGGAGDAAPITSGAWVTIGNYTVGCNEPLNARYFDGQMDDLRIYDHALSPQEVQAVYTEEVDLCGSRDYLPSDLNRDCYVDSDDMLSIVDNWLKSTASSSDSLPVPGTTLYPAGQDIPVYDPQFRETYSLGGEWKLMTERPVRMYKVRVPGVWQNQGPGMSFHGVGYYMKKFDLPFAPQGKRIWLHFENVATYAKVMLNGQELGDHMGAWTPFEFDITDIVQSGNELQVKVDEKPGHFTAGFIPVIEGSWGGIWGDVWLELRPESFIKDMFVTPEVSTSTAKLNIEIHNSAPLPSNAKIEAKAFTVPEGTLAGSMTIDASELDGNGVGLIPVTIANQKLWSPESSNLYTMRLRLLDPQGAVIDQDELKFGMRDFKVEGSKFVLNGNPIYYASILHWGLYHDYLVPSCTKEVFRQEMRKFKELGFNAVNICLFMFPERYYDVADEEGIILWQEYPYWNNFHNAPRPRTTEEKAAFVQEYKEMFKRDRRHTSVLLRSFTLEDHAPDVALLTELYHLGKQMIPGAVLQDNSTEIWWGGIQINEITDFIDHHPYVEVDHWKSEMAGWISVVENKYESKPFVFGEGLDSDTFRDIPAILEHYGQRPWWTMYEHATGSVGIPGFFGPGEFWGQEMVIERLKGELGDKGLGKIKTNSYKHAMLHRKYELEQMRLYDGFAGMSVTGLRDNKLTRPGIFDDLGNLKFSVEDMRRFNAQTIPLIDADRQSRCYRSGETATITCYVSHYDPVNIVNGTLRLELLSTGSTKTFPTVNISKGSVVTLGQWSMPVPAVAVPTEFELRAVLTYGDKTSTNSWPVWIFPAKGTSVSPDITLYDPQGKLSTLDIAGIPAAQEVMITSVLDSTVTNYLNAGGKVVLIDAAAAALPAHGTPFWREVSVERYSLELFGTFPWDGAVDLQFYDMSSRHGYNLNANHTPMLRTINCRSLMQNDVIIQRSYGSGQLIATTLNLTGQSNVAGQCLLGNIVNYLCQ